jgi:hypothetical protein
LPEIIESFINLAFFGEFRWAFGGIFAYIPEISSIGGFYGQGISK